MNFDYLCHDSLPTKQPAYSFLPEYLESFPLHHASWLHVGAQLPDEHLVVSRPEQVTIDDLISHRSAGVGDNSYALITVHLATMDNVADLVCCAAPLLAARGRLLIEISPVRSGLGRRLIGADRAVFFPALQSVLEQGGLQSDFVRTRRSELAIALRKRADRELELSDTTVILPTLNEARSIDQTIRSILASYPGVRVIVADDGSRDGTREQVLLLGKNYEVTLLDRLHAKTKGLTASVVDAMDKVQTTYAVVMDADGQHPIYPIGDIVLNLREGMDLVVACRAEVESAWSWERRLFSRLGDRLAHLSLKLRGRGRAGLDVLSGYFGCRTALWHQSRPSRNGFVLSGFKILFDWLKVLPSKTKVGRVYYRFATRSADQSKVNVGIYSKFLWSCLRR